MKSKALFIALLMVPAIALAGPFGIEMGQSIKTLRILKDTGGGVYQIVVPQPNMAFENYTAIATAPQGICSVSGIGVSIKDDAFGNGARDSLQSLRRVLDQKYGSSELIDYLQDGSIWNDPRDWSTAVDKNERVYQATWDPSTKAKLPSGIIKIELTTRVVNRTTTYVNVDYRFSNFKACATTILAARNKSL